MKGKRKFLLLLSGAGLLSVLFFAYLALAFPRERNSASCHARVTPSVTADWKASKHGVLLVKCAVCHGDSSGKGSIPFAARPTQEEICFKCHEPAIKRMRARFGAAYDNCGVCHPRHQHPLHKKAFEFVSPSKTSL